VVVVELVDVVELVVVVVVEVVVVVSGSTELTRTARHPLLLPLHGPKPSPRESRPPSFASDPMTRLTTTPFESIISYIPQLDHP
jgi:hypothetical protein